MRVLQVIPAMSASAGAETSLSAVAPYLLEAGFDLHLAVLTPHQDLVLDLQRQGVVFHDLAGEHPVAQLRALSSVVRRVRPDLIHASLVQAALPSQVVGLRLGVPVVVTWANTPPDRGAGDVARWKLEVMWVVEAMAAAICRNRFHAVTPGVAATKCAEMHVAPSRVRVAERGRDPDRYQRLGPDERRAARGEAGVDNDEFLFLAVGRQEPQKGYAELLRAFDSIADRNHRARLLIAGRPGSATEELETIRWRLPASNRIEFLGHRDDVPRLLAAADAVVCSSHREGAAGALIEAMAVQTPIVSVELDGMAGVLADGENALVVPRHQLPDAMERMITDEHGAARRAVRARRLFEERFTTPRAAEQLSAVYRWAAGPQSFT